MNARLKELIAEADDGLSDALTIKPETLKKILQELEKMCISSNTIQCEPVAGGPGFKIKVRDEVVAGIGTYANTYALEWLDGQDVLSTDYWDLTEEGGGKDDSNVNLFPTYDSVSWKGQRIAIGSDVGYYDFYDNGAVPATADQYHVSQAKPIGRKITVDSKGNVIRIGPEEYLAQFDVAYYVITP